MSLTNHIFNQADPWDMALDAGNFRCASSSSVFPHALPA